LFYWRGSRPFDVEGIAGDGAWSVKLKARDASVAKVIGRFALVAAFCKTSPSTANGDRTRIVFRRSKPASRHDREEVAFLVCADGFHGSGRSWLPRFRSTLDFWWHDRPRLARYSRAPAQQRDPARQRALAQMVEAAQQRVIVLIGAADWDDARSAAAVYRKNLAPHGHLLQAADRISDRTESEWLAAFKNHRLTLLTSEDDAALRGQAPSYWLDRALAKLYSPFAGPQPLAWQDDPFGWFNNWVLARAQETPVRPRDQELSVSAGERQYVVLPLTLRVPAFAVAGQQALMPVLEQARQAAQQAAQRVEIIEGGVVLHAAAAAAQAQREMSTIGIGSLIGILLLIWLTFRSFKPIALVALSIAVGCLGALSISWLVFGRIHLITLVSVPA
jgi:predicted exporter